MKRLLAVGCVVMGVGVGPSAVRIACGQVEDAVAISIDPAVVLRDMHSVYTTEVIAERIDVRVQDGFAQSRGSMEFRAEPGKGIRIGLGPIQVWCHGGSIIIAHADQLNDYVQFDALDGVGELELLNRSMPPIPCPQAALVLGGVGMHAPTPYTPGIDWKSGELVESAGGGGPLVTLLGVGDDGVSVEMVVDGETSRMVSFAAHFGGGGGGESRSLELAVSPVDEVGEPEPIEIATADRVRLTQVAQLAPYAGDTSAGRRMPPMQLVPVNSLLGEGGGAGPGAAIEFADHESGPRGVYVFFREWGADARLGMDIARAVAERIGGEVVPVCVVGLSADGGWREGLRAARDGVAAMGGGGMKLYGSLAPERTIDRFQFAKDVLLVRTSARGKALLTLDIEPGEGETADDRARDAHVEVLARHIAQE